MILRSARYVFFVLLAFYNRTDVKAQSEVQLLSFVDIGENNISEGIYLKSAILSNYQIEKYSMNAGFQFNLKHPGDKTFSGAWFSGGRSFLIKNFDFEIQGFFIYSSFSKYLFETNWGVLLKVQRRHFHYQLGTNFRGYHLVGNSFKEYDPEVNNKIRENWNIMYLIGYNLKPVDHKWNVGITITNSDHFLINQETNPMLYLHGRYQVSEPLVLYAESWYKSAGALNISVNYFGFFFRTGLIWKIDFGK